MLIEKLNAYRYSLFLILIIVSLQFLVSGCSLKEIVSRVRSYNGEQGKTTSYKAEKRYPLQTRQLTVLFNGNPYSYAVVEGTPVGLEYELIHLFAQEQGFELKVKVVSKESLMDSLQAGAGDIAACNQNGTILNESQATYSLPLITTDLRLIQQNKAKGADKADSSWLNPNTLNGKKIVIPRNSAIKNAVVAYAKMHRLHFTLIQAKAHVSEEGLIQMVAEGTIAYTVADGIMAEAMSTHFKNLNFSTSIADAYPMHWAINKNSVALQETFNAWITKRGRSLKYNLILHKYTNLSKSEKKALENQYVYAKNGSISTYDNLIKSYASAANLDWRLLAALIYQESKFDPHATSHAGAVGLMQVLPATAKWLGNNPHTLKSPKPNIHTGLQYLQWLKGKWQVYIQDEDELIKFTLASYNAGFGHVKDAYELARKYELDPQKWDGNVERMLRNKSESRYYNDSAVQYGYCRGKEPVEYVQKILFYYRHYQNVI
jgi:membrane-bound lytic murein transglycosylase F